MRDEFSSLAAAEHAAGSQETRQEGVGERKQYAVAC